MLPTTAHTDRPWRVHALAPDFDVHDVWALPTPGGPDDFGLLVDQFLHGDTAANPSPIARALFAIRWRLGARLGWDGADTGIGSRVRPLRERIPDDLRRIAVEDPVTLPFTTVYRSDDEWVAEMANSTVHGLMHLGWVPDEQVPGRFRGQMAVLVKPNGRWGRAYMAAIAPLRHLLVYPPLMRGIAASWIRRTAPAVETTIGVDRIPIRFRLAHPDYADTATLMTGSDRSAEWWARTVFEELVDRRSRETLFRGVLGLRAEHGSDTVAGWRIVERTYRELRMTRAGRGLSCEIVVVSGPDAVHLGLAVDYRGAIGARVWPWVAPEHRRMAAELLQRAWLRR